MGRLCRRGKALSEPFGERLTRLFRGAGRGGLGWVINEILR